MESKNILLGIGGQLIISVLFGIYLVLAGVDLKATLAIMALIALVNSIMLLYMCDSYICILCFLNTVGAALQLSMGDCSIKQALICHCLGTLIGLMIYYGLTFLQRKRIDLPSSWIRNSIIVMTSMIFILAFIAGPVSNADQSEIVYGFVKGITVYQLIIPLHLIFVRSYLLEDTKNQKVFPFILFHTMELIGFFASKELGTLLVLFLFSLVVLFLTNRSLLSGILSYILRHEILQWMIFILIVAVIVNHFWTLPLVGERIHQVFAAVSKRILHPDTSQFSSAKQAWSITNIANPVGGLVFMYAASSDMAFVSVNMRFGFLIGILTYLSYVSLLIASTWHLKNYETEEAQDIFMALFILSISALIPIAGALQVIPFTGIPIYFLSSGKTSRLLAYCLAYYVIFHRRKEEGYV